MNETASSARPRVSARPRLRPISEQVVAVVGASSGIGRQTARRLAERGATLVLAARDDAALDVVAAEARVAGAPDVAVVSADVTRPDDMASVARTAVSRFGRLDTWVHVAGVDVWATFEDTTPQEFRRVIEVNLLGAAYGAMAAVPALRAAGGGALIVVSSVEAEVPLPYQSAYTASKHGVSGYVRALRMELQAEGVPISVTEIQPSSIDTPLFRAARTRLGVEPKPAPPVYDPDVVADLIVHATEHPSRDLVAGGYGWLMRRLHRLTPGLTETIAAYVMRTPQRSDRPKDDAATSNLDAPAGSNAVRGGYGGRAVSLGNAVQKVPLPVRLAALLALVLAVTTLRRSRG